MQNKLFTRNLEMLMFNVSDVDKLHLAKHEMLVQFQKCSISINGQGFFEMNNSFVATVSLNE